VATRKLFLGATAATFAMTSLGVRAGTLGAGDKVTQAELFASLPRPSGRLWTRLIMGAGAKYQKQIGLGSETAADGSTRLFYEIEVGSPGGSCNPNTLRKAYLRANHYGSLLDTYPPISNLGRASNLVFRYGDVTNESHLEANDTRLRLLDLNALFDARNMTIVSASTQRLHQANRDVETTHVVGIYSDSSAPHETLRRIELWHAPSFPFGVVRYRATFADYDPFELEAYSIGDNYKTDLPLSLEKVRSLTKNDEYGSIPNE
jgi:hypothetical protein